MEIKYGGGNKMKKIKIVIALVLCIILISALTSVSLAEESSTELENEQTKIEYDTDLLIITTLNHINIGLQMIIYLMV